ncbi:MAG: hypothetical protein ACI4TX_04170 [Christensenellales bacterium]
MYIFNTEENFNGTYICSTIKYNAHYDITKQINLKELEKTTQKANNNFKNEIIDYLNDADTLYRLKKKYITIDFERLQKDINNGINVVPALEDDFENLNDYVINQIYNEPLILNLPLRNLESKNYFIKSEQQIKTNKNALIREITIGTERLHRISATLNDEYIINYAENIFRSEQLYDLLSQGYILNYDLIYANIEELNPFAFEKMSKEMFEKLHLAKVNANKDYLPKNKYLEMKSQNKQPLTTNEVEQKLSQIIKFINDKILLTTNNQLTPIYCQALAKITLSKLQTQLENPKIKKMLKSGELILNDNAIKKDLKTDTVFDANLINFMIQFQLCFEDVLNYLEKTTLKTTNTHIVEKSL